MFYSFDNCSLDVRRRELRRGTDVVDVEPQVFDVLHLLIRNRERVVSKDELLAVVWNGRIISESALSSRITAARSAIGDNGKDQRLIRTLSKQGVRFVGVVTEERAVADANPAIALPHKPSIAVLPFTNLNGDRRQDYFSDGIVEDIITELSRFSELFVIARNSSFQYKDKPVDVRKIGQELGVRYILEGSVRRASKFVRISVQLIEASNGTHCWAERYDRTLNDAFSVQDEVARTVAAVLVAHLNNAEAGRALLKPAMAWQAYDYYLRALQILNTFWISQNTADLYKARELLNRSLEIEPSYARAHALLADTVISVWHLPLDGDYLNHAALERAHRSACEAMQHEPTLPFAHALVALVLGYKRQHEASIEALERAAALNRNYTDWRFVQTFIMAGEHGRAVAAGQAYMRADPFYPPRAAVWLGVAYFMLRRYREALPFLREYVLRVPNSRGAHLWSAANYAQWGRLKEARTEIAAALSIDPKFTVSLQARQAICKHQRDLDHLLDGLRKAGLPEG